MADALVKDLPRDLPSFPARFGTDAQFRAYLVEARWSDGFRCAACGHDRGRRPPLRPPGPQFRSQLGRSPTAGVHPILHQPASASDGASGPHRQ